MLITVPMWGSWVYFRVDRLVLGARSPSTCLGMSFKLFSGDKFAPISYYEDTLDRLQLWKRSERLIYLLAYLYSCQCF